MNEQNRYLFIYTLISFSISCLTCFTLDYGQTLEEVLKIISLIFMPFCIILLLSILGYFTDKKFHNVTVIVSGILNVFVMIIQCLLLLFAITFSNIGSDNGIIDNVKQYKQALKEIDCQKCIEHFPKELPANIKNVQLHKYTHPVFGSEGIVLTFDTDENYIKNAISENKYQKTISPVKNKQYDGYYEPYEYVFTVDSDVQVNTYKLFVIYQKNEYHTAYGIGVKNNNIMYFYSDPD